MEVNLFFLKDRNRDKICVYIYVYFVFIYEYVMFFYICFYFLKFCLLRWIIWDNDYIEKLD